MLAVGGGCLKLLFNKRATPLSDKKWEFDKPYSVYMNHEMLAYKSYFHTILTDCKRESNVK